MYVDVNRLLPALESEDFRSDLSKIISSEEAVKKGYSVDTYQLSQIAGYCLLNYE